MEPCELAVGEIVQINPANDDGRGRQWFGGCLMVVTEPKSFGAQGYVQSTGGTAPWRAESATKEGGAHG